MRSRAVVVATVVVLGAVTLGACSSGTPPSASEQSAVKGILGNSGSDPGTQVGDTGSTGNTGSAGQASQPVATTTTAASAPATTTTGAPTTTSTVPGTAPTTVPPGTWCYQITKGSSCISFRAACASSQSTVIAYGPENREVRCTHEAEQPGAYSTAGWYWAELSSRCYASPYVSGNGCAQWSTPCPKAIVGSVATDQYGDTLVCSDNPGGINPYVWATGPHP